MTIHLGGGIKIEIPDDQKPIMVQDQIGNFANNVRAYPVRLHLARIKSQLKDFSIKSMKWRDEQ